MTEQKTIDLNLVELTSLAANILDSLFLKAPKDKAKPIFKDLKQGKRYPLGTVKIQNTLEPKLHLELDYSEFCGPGFNFDAFIMALRGILTQVSQQFKMKGDLNIMTSDTGSVMIHLPGMIQIGEQLNAMVLAFEMGNQQQIGLRLMFVDPAQYEALRKDKAESGET